MALIPWNDPNLDRILDRAYEDYVDRLLDEACAETGECCENCRHFCRAWSGDPKTYCEKWDDDEGEVYEEVDPDYWCEDYEWDMKDDEPEVDY